MVTRIGIVATVLVALVGCVNQKTVAIEYYEEVAVSSTSRPLPADYTVVPALAVAEVCDDGEPAVVSRLIDRARGEHDALVQLVVQRTRTERWNRVVNLWGVTTVGDTLVGIDVCYEVSGYPVDLPVSRPPAPPTPAPIATPSEP